MDEYSTSTGITDIGASFLQQALAAISQNAFTVFWLALLGAVIGVACVQWLTVFFMPRPSDEEKWELTQWKKIMPRVSFLSGAAWTAFIVHGYLQTVTQNSIVIVGLISLGVAACAGSATPFVYEILRAGFAKIKAL